MLTDHVNPSGVATAKALLQAGKPVEVYCMTHRAWTTPLLVVDRSKRYTETHLGCRLCKSADNVTAVRWKS
jgi:hypothetical protein